ncbi:hypothetical protein [Marivivens donghaensis]|uniref:hypothetical protein n=1 Tax=Marivivens donghaensis TaxID=1699413 RepID=UPI003F6A056F
MNIKLATLAAVSVLGLGTAAFAEPIECQSNYWCELPVETTASSIADILYGNEWLVSMNGSHADYPKHSTQPDQ